MKTEWQFPFETKGFHFEKEHKYKATTKGLGSYLDEHGDPLELSFEIRISPDRERHNPRADQCGNLFITLPLTYEKSEPVVHELACYIAHKISFEYGEFNIMGGMTICKRIPETPEEEKEVGDAPYAVHMSMVEVPPVPAFNPEDFIEQSGTPMNVGLISQHVETKKTKNPIDRFLGFFKILESQFPPQSKRQHIRDCLKNSKELFSVFTTVFKFDSADKSLQEFNDFIDAIVHARHRCAHLKADKKFGYVPIDPKVKEEVEPYLVTLEMLTYETIKTIKNSV